MDLTYKRPLWLIPVFIFFSMSALSAQNWTQAQLFGESRQSMQGLLQTDQGLVIALAFSESIELDQQIFNSRGEEDILVFRYREGMAPEPILTGGSNREDEISAIDQDADGNLWIAGSFWSSIDFGSFQLDHNSESPKALFLIKMDPTGQLLWSRVFTGGGSIKQIKDLSIDTEGSVFLGGFFNEELILGDTTLTGTAPTSAFYAKIDADGTLDWAGAFGDTGDTRSTVVSTQESDQYYLGGFYNDTLKVGNQVFPANTNDDDAFILALDPTGTINWARKAGGVFEEMPTAMTTDEVGNVYMCGQLVGVLVVNDSLRIESRDGNADCFLIKYDPLGQAKWAYAFGGDQLQFVNDLQYHQEHLWLTGHFQENLKLGDLSISADQSLIYRGFLAQVDTLGQAQKLERLASENGPVLINFLAKAETGVWIGGDFSGLLNLDNLSLKSPIGGFSSFIAQYGTPVTAIDVPFRSNPTKIYPNPTNDQLFIKNLPLHSSYRVINGQGKILYRSGSPEEQLSTKNWPAGLYYLQINGPAGHQTLPFVVN